jgi:putative tryptophan/tyrosine transport system substrate-binding protein
MLRRAVLVFGAAASLCLATVPVSVRSQTKDAQLHRIGLLWAGTRAENVTRRNALLQGLRELGWVEQQTITLDELWADGHYDRLPALASELAARNVEVILALNGTPATAAAAKATTTIPIVAPAIGDPVASGLARSFAKPGGNVTGITNLSSDLYPKRLALLKQALPELKHVALFMNKGNPASAEGERWSQDTARSLGLDLETFDVRDAKDFEQAFEKVARGRAQAVLVGADFRLMTNTDQLGKLALRYKLPLMASYYAPGVLLSYNVKNEESYWRAAAYVDKILKGAKAGDIPIEQPAHISLIVDLKTAAALGITIPQSVVLRADEVIR